MFYFWGGEIKAYFNVIRHGIYDPLTKLMPSAWRLEDTYETWRYFTRRETNGHMHVHENIYSKVQAT
jgi:hypothetical protein